MVYLELPLQKKPQDVAKIWCALELLQTWVWGFENQSLYLARPVPVQLRGCMFAWFLSKWAVRVFAWSVDTRTLEWSWQSRGIHSSYIWLLAGNKNMNIRWVTIPTSLGSLPSNSSHPPQTPQVRLKASYRWEVPLPLPTKLCPKCRCSKDINTFTWTGTSLHWVVYECFWARVQLPNLEWTDFNENLLAFW